MDFRKTLFISDLHLEEKRPEIAQIFFDFLKNLPPKTDAVYILGDLFESWIGDDDRTAFNQAVFDALKTVTQKDVPVYVLTGNRDFLLGNKFFRDTGCVRLSDPEKIYLYNSPLLVMHGDALCTRDLAYMRIRKRAHNVLLQKSFLLLPLRIRRKIAKNLRQKSGQYVKTSASEIMDVSQEEVERMMEKYEVSYLIHGHTHQPAIHNFYCQNIMSARIVLGSWHGCGSYLVWDEKGNKSLEKIINF